MHSRRFIVIVIHTGIEKKIKSANGDYQQWRCLYCPRETRTSYSASLWNTTISIDFPRKIGMNRPVAPPTYYLGKLYSALA